MQKRYRYTGETKVIFNISAQEIILNQIQALIDMPIHNVKKGDIGGWIEQISNLPMLEESWVADDAMVYGNANIAGTSCVKKKAKVFDSAFVVGNSTISGKASVSGNALITDSEITASTMISNQVKINGSKIGGKTIILGFAIVSNSYIVSNELVIRDNVQVENSKVKIGWSHFSDFAHIVDSFVGSGQHCDRGLTIAENAYVRNSKINANKEVFIGGSAQILDNAMISGHDIQIEGMAVVRGNVRIGLNTTLDAFAVVDGGNNSTLSHHSFFSKSLTNDDKVIF